MSRYAYSFEARSIQSYILDGGRLADMVAASELVDRLCGAPLDAALAAGDIAGQARFSRRAGGAFRAMFDSKASAERLRDVWSLFLPLYAPGLEFVHAVTEGNSEADAAQNGARLLAALRNFPAAALPEAGPLIERSPRTGLPATRLLPLPGGEKELVDAATERKRDDDLRKSRALSGKFLEDESYQWPLLVEPEKGKEDLPSILSQEGSRYVGVIHADGNGLGRVLIALENAMGERGPGKTGDYARLFLGFSEALERAIRRAAHAATNAVLQPAADERPDKSRKWMPARPLVLGGDDLAIIVRADLARPFVERFIDEFEAASKTELTQWKQREGGIKITAPEGLTMCAGIAYVKATQPFHLAYGLAEEMCQAAKRAGAPYVQTNGFKPSSLAFARVTTSLVDEYESLIGGLPGGERLSLGAYGTGRHAAGLPALDALDGLIRVLSHDDMARGPVRKLLTLLQQDPAEARRSYRRWREVLKRRDDSRDERDWRLSAFDAALAQFGTVDEKEDRPFVSIGGQLASPIGDAVTLMTIARAAASNTHLEQRR